MLERQMKSERKNLRSRMAINDLETEGEWFSSKVQRKRGRRKRGGREDGLMIKNLYVRFEVNILHTIGMPYLIKELF